MTLRAPVIDAFIFFNEAELCELRLRLLGPVVERFVVVEADATHSGSRRDFMFPGLLEGPLRAYREKILYYPMHLDLTGLDFSVRPSACDADSAALKLENRHRSGIDEACRDFDEASLVVISDADEIPDPNALAMVSASPEMIEKEAIALQQYLFYYKLTHLQVQDWRGSVVTTVARLHARGAQWHRDRRWELAHLERAGWHLSYFGGSARVRLKIESFCHQELNVDAFKSDANIAQRIADGGDLYGRGVDVLPTDTGFFPAYFVEATATHRDFFW